MKTEYVLQYKENRKWHDLQWKSAQSNEAILERDYRIDRYKLAYRVVERKTTETVIK